MDFQSTSTFELEPSFITSSPLSSPYLESNNESKSKRLKKNSPRANRLPQLIQALLKSENSTNKAAEKNIKKFNQMAQGRITHKISLNTLTNFILKHSNLKEDKTKNSTLSLNKLVYVNKKTLLKQLCEWGYTALAQKLESNTGELWDELMKISCPILMEQVAHLYLLCIKQAPNNEEHYVEILVKFAINLGVMTNFSNGESDFEYHQEVLQSAKHIFGKLIYLIDNDIALAFRSVGVLEYSVAIENIQSEFKKQTAKICKNLEEYYNDHVKTLLQAPIVALSTRIPLELAKALLTNIGTINIGIIDALSEIFLPYKECQHNHQASLYYGLKLLQESPFFRSEFEKIQSPRSRKSHSQEVIRASLGLLPTTKVDKYQTRLTALTAILSHLRQGGDGSCFAVSLAIEILSAHLFYGLKDFRELLEKGKLTRLIEGRHTNIPFVKRINDDNLKKLIIFDREGRLIIREQKQGFLWQAPGIKAACNALGHVSCKDTILLIIQNLPKEKPFYQMNVSELLNLICALSQQKNSKKKQNPSYYFLQACFAFSSHTAQPLLKTWENTLAGMSEIEEQGMIKKAILESVLQTFQTKLTEMNIPPSESIRKFFMHLQRKLSHDIRLQYDPLIYKNSTNKIMTKRSGFVLYRNKKSIDNPQAFVQLLLDFLLEITTALRGKQEKIEKNKLNEMLEILTSYITKPIFISDLLILYHSNNIKSIRHLSYTKNNLYDRLKFTPWITIAGNNSKAVMRVYFESSAPLPSYSFTSKSSYEALIKIIDMCKEMPQEEKLLFLNNPNKLKPFFIGGKHRLSFMAGAPSLVGAWMDQTLTENWIKQNVLQPGLEVSNHLIDRKTQKDLLKMIKQYALIHLELKSQIPFLIENFKKNKELISIQQYRDQVLKLCVKKNFKRDFVKKLARKIDNRLYQSLKPELKKKLERSAVHFANTNWCKETDDLLFCFVVNPGTGNLELYETNPQGDYLNALDQNYWLLEQKWEFLTIPQHLAIDDQPVTSELPRED